MVSTPETAPGKRGWAGIRRCVVGCGDAPKPHRVTEAVPQPRAMRAQWALKSLGPEPELQTVRKCEALACWLGAASYCSQCFTIWGKGCSVGAEWWGQGSSARGVVWVQSGGVRAAVQGFWRLALHAPAQHGINYEERPQSTNHKPQNANHHQTHRQTWFSTFSAPTIASSLCRWTHSRGLSVLPSSSSWHLSGSLWPPSESPSLLLSLSMAAPPSAPSSRVPEQGVVAAVANQPRFVSVALLAAHEDSDVAAQTRVMTGP